MREERRIERIKLEEKRVDERGEEEMREESRVERIKGEESR